MSNSSYIVFIVRQWETELYLAKIEKITAKFVFIEYRSSEYHETRLKKSKIRYKVFDTHGEALAFLDEMRAGSTHTDWREHHRLAEENKRLYKAFIRDRIRAVDDWDEIDEMKFCKHLRQVTVQSEENPKRSKTTCKDCGKVLHTTE